MNVDERKKARSQAKRRFTRTCNNLQKAVDDDLILKTVESRYNDLKDAWKEVQQKHDEYMEQVTEESDEEEEWINDLNKTYCEIEETADAYIEKKTKENESERKVEDEKKYTEELRIHREQEGVKLMQHIDDIQKMIDQTTENKSDICEALKRGNKHLADRIATCERIHLKYITTIKDQQEREEEKDWILPLLNSYSKVCTEIQVFISCNLKHITRTNEEITVKNNLKLERLKFNTFDGDLRKYPKFKSEFTKYIQPSYKEEEAVFVLKSYLSEKVQEEVYNIDVLEEVWSRLDKRYGDKGKHIDAIMAAVKNIQKYAEDEVTEIIDMINTIEKAHQDLLRLGFEKEINNSTIVSIIEERMPENLKKEWIKLAAGTKRLEIASNKFPHLLQLLLEYRERLEYEFSNIRTDESFRGKVHMNNATKGDNKPKCWIHQSSGDHPIWRCRVFENKTPNEKVELVKSKNACFACLEIGHVANRCTRGFKCKEDGCGLPHHQLLHEAHKSGIVFHNYNSKGKAETILQLQRIYCSKGFGLSHPVNVMWDAGSTISLINFKTAEELKLLGRKIKLEITTVGGITKTINSYSYQLFLHDKENRMTSIEVYGIQTISTDICEARIKNLNKIFKNVNLAEIERPNQGTIDCLIGFQYAAFHPVREQAVGHLLLLRNQFGYVIGGSHPQLREATKKLVKNVKVYQLSHKIEDFFSIEGLGIECQPRCGGCKCGKCHPGGKNMTLKEEREYHQIDENMIYIEEEKRWEASYPWIRDPHELPDNRCSVLAKLKSTEKRLLRDENYAQIYKRQIDDMISRGVARKVSSNELSEYEGPIHYIAHHAVFKPESKSTPCRIVFNSSANYHGHILNEYFAKGPDIMNKLLGVLLRFREERIGFIGDISKMFYSIKIPRRDQMTHLFLWRDLMLEKEPDTYAITAVNIGDRPSATIAIVALKKTAERKKQEFPEAAKTITDNSYMDDIIDSVSNEQKASKRTEEIEEVLGSGNFKIKEWTITGIKKEDNNMTKDQENLKALTELPVNNTTTEKVLGMKWDFQKDNIMYDIKKHHMKPDNITNYVNTEYISKRQILAIVNGIYDPLGLISPFTVKAKILMRRIWAHKTIDWDDPIPESLKKEWESFFNEICMLQSLNFPRSIKPKNANGKPDLVIFSDGSKEAYGAVAYARWQRSDGNFESRLIASKNRIAPVKTIDIVRLELSGAVISKRLRSTIETETRISFNKVYHIVDSEIVKAMINKESYGFSTFAANRIGEIQQSTQPNEWYWVRGCLNIADWLTRGKSPTELNENSIWQKGPQFLATPVSEWPITSQTNVIDIPEQCKEIFVAVTDGQVTETLADRIDINKFSNLSLLQNTTAWILRLYHNYKTKNNNHINENFITIQERKSALTFWIKEAQRNIDVRSAEYIKLLPRIKDEIIVVGGRTERWMASTWNKQEFVLLPFSHRLSYLVALTEHYMCGHLGVNATIARIRSKYWIIRVRVLVKQIVSKCIFCCKKRKSLCTQVMGQLPLERIQPSPPFSLTGVDFFGSYTIKGEVQNFIIYYYY